MKSKIKFIDKSRYPKCRKCKGKGYVTSKSVPCKTCKGTGKYKVDNYHLIYTDKKGKKSAFQVDSFK